MLLKANKQMYINVINLNYIHPLKNITTHKCYHICSSNKCSKNSWWGHNCIYRLTDLYTAAGV